MQSDPPRSASAAFVLEGNPRDGQLWLNTPLGTNVAWARWRPGQAQWRSGTKALDYASIDDLMTETLGTPLPLDQLFAWMAGQPLADADWQVDLSQHAQGRWSAKRLREPSARIQVVMDTAP